MYPKFIGYQCSLCKKTFSIDDFVYICPIDRGNLNVNLDYKAINNRLITKRNIMVRMKDLYGDIYRSSRLMILVGLALLFV